MTKKQVQQVEVVDRNEWKATAKKMGVVRFEMMGAVELGFRSDGVIIANHNGKVGVIQK